MEFINFYNINFEIILHDVLKIKLRNTGILFFLLKTLKATNSILVPQGYALSIHYLNNWWV